MLVLNPLNRQFTDSPHEVLLCTIFLALGCRKYSIWFAALQILCHSLKHVKPAMDLHATMSTLQSQHCGSTDSFLNCLCVQWDGRLSILKTRIVNLKWQMEIFFFLPVYVSGASKWQIMLHESACSGCYKISLFANLLNSAYSFKSANRQLRHSWSKTRVHLWISGSVTDDISTELQTKRGSWNETI